MTPATHKLEIRDARADDARGIARIHAAAWKATYRGIMPDAVLDEKSEESGTPRFRQRIEESTDPTFPFLVALINNEVAGFSHATPPTDAPEPPKASIVKSKRSTSIPRIKEKGSEQVSSQPLSIV